MTVKVKTKAVSRDSAGTFLQKAQQFLNAARMSFDAGDFNASAANSVHACISACDAICAKHLGLRAAGERHLDAANLIKTIKPEQEFTENAGRFSRVIAIKSLAEYEDRLVFKKDSESALKNAEKFMEFVINSIK